MTRSTSVAVYRQIQRSGLLSTMRMRVYSHLFANGPLTGHELDAEMAAPTETMTSYHKRLSELERMGVVRTVGKRKCGVTGRQSLTWDVTDQLPTPLPARRTWKQRAEAYRRVISEHIVYCDDVGLHAEARRLRSQIAKADHGGP